MSVTIDIRGLSATKKYFSRFPEIATQASRLAVNDAARFAARLGSSKIRQEVAFSRTYIGAATNPNARLRIKRVAKGDDLVAVISARSRATSLARFARGTPSFGRQRTPPRVRVATQGASRKLPGAFFVKLRSGPSLNEDNYNVGLAVRLKPGQRIRNKRRMAAFGGGVYLLYGPSVSQVFDTVREDISPDVARYAATEFLRQFGRLTRG